MLDPLEGCARFRILFDCDLSLPFSIVLALLSIKFSIFFSFSIPSSDLKVTYINMRKDAIKIQWNNYYDFYSKPPYQNKNYYKFLVLIIKISVTIHQNLF